MFDLLISLHFVNQKPSQNSLIHFNHLHPQLLALAEIAGVLAMRTKASSNVILILSVALLMASKDSKTAVPSILDDLVFFGHFAQIKVDGRYCLCLLKCEHSKT